ncbi:Cilia- and flagella-associated protein isoform 1 [Schistosoma japonicum]|uniref:Cilia-and flagella-associated protein isoform 1 n=1 Tax=Schistosoma japonicum TaxID=6182 RepID=A0A4Z2DRP9_SCHJA|nr:Cilia- and flagella-associated protein isoform 1 [Schistosoma japonicum]
MFTHHYEPRVLATALRQPITIEPKNCILKFITNLNEKVIESTNVLYQHLSIKSLINLPMKWHLAVHKIQRFNKRGHGKLTIHNVQGLELLPDLDGYINGDFTESDDKTIHFEIRLCTGDAGYYWLELPIYLTFPKDTNCEESPKSNSTLYKTLQIHIELKKLELKFEPERILIPPVPTGVNVRIPVTLIAYQLNQPIKILGFWNFSPACEVQLPVSEENIQCPFNVEYPEGQILKPQSNSSKPDTGSLNLFVNFNCKLNGLVLAPNPRPLCLIIIGSTISFDSSELCYSSNRSPRDNTISSYICSTALPVSAAVDNCLISWFDYITRRPNEFKLTDYQHLRSKLQEMKSNESVNITSFYHWFDELKLSQNNHSNSEDTFSDQSFTVRSGIHQNFDEDCLNCTRNTQTNIYETSQHSFIHREFSEHSEDNREISFRTSSSEMSPTITSYRSSLFLPDWHLIDRVATEQVQRWLGVHGFPTGRYQFKFPDDFRNCISLTATLSDISIMGEKQKSFNKSQQNTTIKNSSQNSNREMNNKSNIDSNSNNNNNTNETVLRSLNPLYNCLLHLCGNKQPPGLFPTINLPIYNPYEALSVVYFYCSALLTFARSQGSCLPHILPEHLMEPNDYHLWHKFGCPGLTESARTVYTSLSQNNSIVTVSDWTVTQKRRNDNQSNDNLIKIDLSPLSESEPSQFLLISERAWTDVLMQLIKCLLFNRITISSLDSVNLPPKDLLLYKTGESMSGTSTLSKQSQSQNESYKSDQVITHNVHLLDQTGPTQRSRLLNFNEIQVISCYSPCERILLAWLNYCYHQYACQLWPEMKSVSPNNWIVTNFDNDLRDGIVLACTVGAYLPSLIPNFFSKVYIQPSSNEQRFHNAIIIVQALKIIRFEFDLCPSDITSPHPFGMALLCLHLFCQLPDYLPKQTMNFTGVLNSTTKRQLLLTNTSSHMLTYYCVIIGPNANDFSCSVNNYSYKNTERENNKTNSNRMNNKQLKGSINGNNISNSNDSQLCNSVKEMKVVIPPKGKLKLYLEYKSRFLKVTEAVFLAVSQRQNALQGKTMSFILSGTVGGLDNSPFKIVKSPCYQMTEFKIPIVNPYKFKGAFNITVIESCNDLFIALCQTRGMNIKKKESTSGNVLSTEAYSVTDSSLDQSSSDNSQLPPEIMKEYYQRNQYQSFYCRESTINLCGNTAENKINSHLIKQSDNKVMNTKHKKQQQIVDKEKYSTNELSVIYLPLNWGIRECCLLLSNEKIGEFVILLKGIAQLPQPSLLPFTNEFNIDKSGSEQKERGYRIKSAIAAASFGRSGDPNVIYFRCPIGCEIKETLRLPVKNDLRRTALLTAIHIRLSPSELKHRQLANTLESDELLELANKKLILPNFDENLSEKKLKFQKRLHISRYLIYSVEIDTDMIKVPSKVHVPIHTDLDTDDTFPLPLKIIADKPGLTSAKLVIQGPDDIRLYRIECVALPSNEKIVLSFTSPLNHPITQPIPIVNKTAYDWELYSQFIGNPLWFTGPSTVNVPSNTTVQYSITYLPRRETESRTKLLLCNITDGSQLEYHLNGIVLKPLSLGKINLEFTINVGDMDEEVCTISKQNHLQTFSLKIPNSTSVKQSFQLQTNLPKGLIEWVPNNQKRINRIEVMSGRTDECKFQVNVSRQGSYRGVIVFVADSPIDNSDSENDEESMKNHKNGASKALNDLDENSNQIYRLWYEVEINIKPGPPIKQVEIICPCLSCKTIELPFRLQSESFKNIQIVEFEVGISDECLSGPKTHCVNSINSFGKLSTVYQLHCIPSIVGISNLAVTFYHPNCGEFWIELIVKALKPETVNIPTIEAELGSSKISKILLDNPTKEMYILKPKIFNSDVFKLQLSTSAKQLACLSPSIITESNEKHQSHFEMSTLCQSSDNDILNTIDELTNKSSCRLLTNRGNASHSTEGIIRLKPQSKLYLGLKFTPCAIGEEEHHGSIVFYSDKLTEWCFNLRGNGIAPQPRDPITVSVMIGSATTVIVPIINPFKFDTVLDINLCETTLCGLFKHLEDTRNDIYKNQLDNKSINSASVDNKEFNDQLTETNECNCDDNDNKPYCRSLSTDPTNINIYSAFQLLIKEKKNIRLSSKTVFDIPISFAPLEMREHEALCTVIMRKLDSSKFKSSRSMTSMSSSSSIRWLIPIKGIPEMKSLLYPSSNEFHLPYPYQSKKNASLVIDGTVRSKSCYVITLRLFNSFTHTINDSALSEQMKDIEIHNVQSDEDKKLFNEKMFHETSESLFNQSTLWEHIQVGNLEWTLKPVIKKDDEQLAKLIELDKTLTRSLIMKLLQVKKHDDLEMTEINLGMIFSPSLSFKCSADLMIRTCLGAIWKFGLIFKSKDPPIDDIIYIPHKGIGRSVKVQLPLTSQTNEPMQFIARLYPENQTEYTVEPKEGILPPTNAGIEYKSKNSPIVITFKPTTYGKPIIAQLIIQVS